MEWLFFVGLAPALPLAVIVWLDSRLIRQLEESNRELAATLGDLARVEHGLAPQRDDETTLQPLVSPESIYAELEEFMTARHEWEDDPSLRQDEEPEGIMPPGLLDSAGDDEMT